MRRGEIEENARSVVDELNEARVLCPTFGPTCSMLGQLELFVLGRPSGADHIRLGKLLTHPRASMRLGVLDYLADENIDLDLGLWLRRLSHDQSPAVRAAAVRVMSQQTHSDLSDRIDQMARSDPSPTVAQLARFYLEQGRAAQR